MTSNDSAAARELPDAILSALSNVSGVKYFRCPAPPDSYIQKYEFKKKKIFEWKLSLNIDRPHAIAECHWLVIF